MPNSQRFCAACDRPGSQAKYCHECGNLIQQFPESSGHLTVQAAEPEPQPSNRGKVILILIGVCTLILVYINAFSKVSQPPTSRPSVQPELSATPRGVEKPQIAKVNEARIFRLKKDFVITTDEFNGVKTYRHRVFSKYMNGNGTTIEAEIREKDSQNAIYTQSQFVSEDWIFHQSYEVMSKGVMPLASEGESQREVINGGGICEVVRSTPKVSLLISAAIKAAQDKHEPVRVRLAGRFNYDYTLRPVFERAIAETYELYSLIASGS